MSHSPGCAQTGTRQIRGDKDSTRGASTRIYGGGKGFTAATGEQVGYAGPDGLETVPAWQCDQGGCPVAELDRQSGNRPSGGGVKSVKRRDDNAVYGKGLGYSDHPDVGGDQGGASRFFPQFAHDPEYDAPFLYQAKASARERNQGLGGDAGVARNSHPT